ncbi:MAG: DUF4338 domain-containing protein [Rhodospirillales bacterium]|nr:DUF4338 domain-containing protein [Rhodospirillales bacterium]
MRGTLPAIVLSRLPADWAERYNIVATLIETVVETARCTGAIYRASSWTRVGITQGKGRYDRHTNETNPKRTSG